MEAARSRIRGYLPELFESGTEGADPGMVSGGLLTACHAYAVVVGLVVIFPFTHSMMESVG